MHELSLVANLFDLLEEKTRNRKVKKILLIKLQVGILSGVVPEFLISAFDIYKKETLAEEAEMQIKVISLKILCQNCLQETLKDDFAFICERCGSTDLKTLSGTELILERIECEI